MMFKKAYKVALIGNMNNNHFAMMRYFHVEGIEAHLFRFKDEFPHFKPECDTWEIEKYNNYIHQLPFGDGNLKHYYKYTRKQLYNILGGYDFYIGNGLSPAYLKKAGIKLNLFLPYAVWIEFINERNKPDSLYRYFSNKLHRYVQLSAIKKNVESLCAIDPYTVEIANKIKVPVIKLPIPMVFNLEKKNVAEEDIVLNDIINLFQKHDFIAFSHTSHFSPVDSIKKIDIFIRAFATFTKDNCPAKSPLLVLLEYGPYVEGNKQLIHELGITSHVKWIHRLLRKEIMILLDYVHVGAGAFGGYIWGGTGWEFISKGVPFFQYVNIDTAKNFESCTGLPMPPFYNMNNVEEIALKLQELVGKDNSEISNKLKRWFDHYGGVGVIHSYIKIMEDKLALRKELSCSKKITKSLGI